MKRKIKNAQLEYSYSGDYLQNIYNITYDNYQFGGSNHDFPN